MTLVFKFFQIFSWCVSRFLGMVFLDIKYEGQENISYQNNESVIYIANHQGYFDIFLISSAIKLSQFRSSNCLRTMTYYKHITTTWYGPFIMLLGAYPVYTKLKSLEASLKRTIGFLKNHQDVLMFPSGKIDKEFSANDARPGIAYLAKELNPLIIPVYISGTHKLGFWEFILRKRKVLVRYGKGFYYQEKTSEKNDLNKMAIMISGEIEKIKQHD